MSEDLTKEGLATAIEALSKEINTQMDDDTSKVLPDNRVTVDPEYLHKIKMKVEKLLSKLIKHYKLTDFISDKYRYRIGYDKFCKSDFYTKFRNKQDINGNRLRYGHDYIPETIEDWLYINMPDYMVTEDIYGNICEYRRILKDDLASLNKIAKVYKVVEDED